VKKTTDASRERTAADDAVFERYSAYYDLLYRDKDYDAETAYIARTLRRVVPGGREILEFGSGTGRHGRLLAREGYNVSGVERSEAMVALAGAGESLGGSGRFHAVHGDIRTATVEGVFDAVISLFHVVSYLTDNADIEATFRNAARHLRPDGVFFFDVWHGPAVLTQRPVVRLKKVENEEIRLWRVAEPALDTEAGVVTVHYTMFAESKREGGITTFDETHRMRYLFPTEIALLARGAGFVVESTEEFGSARPASSETWGVAYVLRKAGDPGRQAG
jgi:SAM-dependent methyltransferase